MAENVLPPEDEDSSEKSHEQGKDKDSNKKPAEQKQDNAQTINDPDKFDIERVETLSDDEIEQGGIVESWEPLTIASLEALERLRMRAFLTYSTVSLWILWTLLGLIQLFLTGNPFLILTSPPVGGLLFIIFKYYFR